MSKTTIKKANGLVMEVDSDAAVAYAFHQSEALGEITIRPCAFGLEVICPAVDPNYPIALIDLYPQSVKGQTVEENPLVQILVQSPAQRDELIARFRFFPVQTRVDFEKDVERFPSEVAMNGQYYALPLNAGEA